MKTVSGLRVEAGRPHRVSSVHCIRDGDAFDRLLCSDDLVTGAIGAKVLGHFTGWETAVSPLTIIVAIGFSGAVGVFFGYYPARKAAAMNPIQALRYE